MRWLRRPLILIHRYLGIILSLLFFMWFISGIAMIYARGMPSLTPAVRLERMPALVLSAISISAAEAAAKAGMDGAGRAVLLTVMERPAYRFGPVTVFADDGEVLGDVDAREALAIAARFMMLPSDRVRFETTLTYPDQWTIPQRGQMPLHKITADDGNGTVLYVSPVLGEVVVQTTRASRMLAWVAAIPHWLYFAPLRLRGQLWLQVIIWTSIVACVAVLIGLLLAVLQLRRAPPRIPYTGWLRWHYISGAIFGVITLTWTFSGLLSVEPWDWAKSGEGLGEGMLESLTGGPLNLEEFPRPDAAQWAAILSQRPIKEVDFLRIQGAPYFAARSSPQERTLIAANPLRVQTESFNEESLLRRLKAPNPDVPVAESTLLYEYDSYYYDGARQAPLPVLRVKFDDPYQTWFYVDPKMGQIVARYHRLGRVERWIYRGFHSLDFSFWYYNRPLWDIGVIALSLGGATLSGIGVVISFKRILRFFKKRRGASATMDTAIRR